MKYLSACLLDQLIRKIKSGELKSEELIDEICNKLDNWDNKVKSFLPEVNRRERLQNDLKKLCERFPDDQKRPLLFGIPIGIKDIFHVNGFATKGGSNLPVAALQGEESTVVTLLKQAGALILGKTVTTEFAYFHPGATGNPHNINHTPGGSSSGSAAAVAAGFCPLTLGTQTIGSISRPASFCGVVGFKPSFGRISTRGVIPFSTSADHVGFFTQNLNSSKIVAGILCKNWNSGRKVADIKPVLGIPEGNYLKQASDDVIQKFYTEIEKLRNLGFTIKTVPALPNIEEINRLHQIMNAAEFAQVHIDLYKLYREKYHTASRQLIEKGKVISQQGLQAAIAGRFIVRRELASLKETAEIDLWISPSAPTTAPFGLASTGDPVMNLPWTYAGLPTLSIPRGFINELPFALQLAGSFNEDEELFAQLNQIEKYDR